MKAQLYNFYSSWELPALKQEVWRALTDQPLSWQDWWPELNDMHDMNMVQGLSGTTFICVWQAPFGYRLRSEVTVKKVIDLEEVTLSSDGDIRGTVTCWLNEKTGSTNVKIYWRVKTTKAWMNYLAPLLKPLFVYSHHAIMRSGERGLRNYLEGKA